MRLDFDPLAAVGTVEPVACRFRLRGARSPRVVARLANPVVRTGAVAFAWKTTIGPVSATSSTLVRTLQTIPAQSKTRVLCTKLRN